MNVINAGGALRNNILLLLNYWLAPAVKQLLHQGKKISNMIPFQQNWFNDLLGDDADLGLPMEWILLLRGLTMEK